jgi:O-antigen/teichoic acid export membrane protein
MARSIRRRNMPGFDRKPLLAAVGKLAIGSVSGYALVVLLTPVLTRVYTPADLGAFSVIAAFVGVLPPILALGYPFGQLSAKTRTGTVRFAATALVSAVSVSALVLVIGLALATVTSAPATYSLVVISSLACSLVAVINSVAVNWAIRQGREGRAASATFMNLGGRAVFQAGFGAAIGGVKGLVLGELAGRLATWAIAELGMSRVALRRGASRLRTVFHHARSERSYPTLVTPALTAENLLVWLPAPAFAFAFGAEIGGLVALVQRFASVPLTIANQSLATLFHREFARRAAGDTARVRKMLVVMASVVGVCSLLLSALFERYGSGLAIAVFGGEQWSGVATIAAAFVPVCAAQFICLFTDRILLVIGRNGLKLAFLACALLIMAVTLMAAQSLGWSWEAAVWAYGASQTAVYLLLFFSVIRASRDYRDPSIRNEV